MLKTNKSMKAFPVEAGISFTLCVSFLAHKKDLMRCYNPDAAYSF